MYQNSNPFSRVAYTSQVDPAFTHDVPSTDQFTQPEPYAGGDLEVWFNNVKVCNLEALTYSMSTEIVGNYVFGDRDPKSFTKGKRVIVGSMSMQQWRKHALLEEVFKLSEYNRGRALTSGLLYEAESVGAEVYAKGSYDYTVQGAAGTTGGVRATNSISTQNIADDTLTLVNQSTSRGLTKTEYQDQQARQVEQTILSRARKLITYSDQIPPFDITVVGVNDSGHASAVTLYGIQITQETDGKSMNDMNPTIGLSFVCRAVSPWRELYTENSR